MSFGVTVTVAVASSAVTVGASGFWGFVVKADVGITTVFSVAPSPVVTVAFPLLSTNIAFASGFTSLILAVILSFSSCFNSFGFSTSVFSSGIATSSPAFGLLASAAVFTRADAGITAVLSFVVVTFAFPFSSTSTVEPGFTSFILAVILSFSSCFNSFGFTTSTLDAGVTTSSPAPGWAASALVFTKSPTGITSGFPSFGVTVVSPLCPTSTVAPGFTACTLSPITFFSPSVTVPGVSTTVLDAGVLTVLLFSFFTTVSGSTALS